MEFDSARISPNGKYALVLKGDDLNGCAINYWTLYENGLNKPIAEYIVMLKGNAYFLTYEKEGATDTLTYKQNDEEFTWNLSKKCRIKDLIKQYELTVRPKNRTKELKVTVEALPDIKLKIPYEFGAKSVGDSIERTAQRIEIKFKYNDKHFYTTQIPFLSDPKGIKESELNFEAYCREIQKQIKQSIYWNDYGMLFLTADKINFLKFKIESVIFKGWTYSKVDNYEYITNYSDAAPGADFNLLRKN